MSISTISIIHFRRAIELWRYPGDRLPVTGHGSMLRMWPLNIARCLRSSSRNLAGKAPIGDCDVFQAQEQLTALPADCLMHATRRRKTDQAPCIQLSIWAFLCFAWSSPALLCFVLLPTCLLCFALASQGPSKAQRLENPMTGYRGVMAAKDGHPARSASRIRTSFSGAAGINLQRYS